MAFHPKLDTLRAQLALWPELEQAPAIFTRYGRTALVLRLGHRCSDIQPGIASPVKETGILRLSGFEK